nr:putative reverse transcriptase domain-containing protein [Tanacetum cinerariifolium]GFB13401.1 putative reverse transcriptase domain-containing protein [Tanacetum cinerariifolium]
SAKPQEKKRKQATETSDKPPKAKKSKYGWVSKKHTLKHVATSEAEDVPIMKPQVTTEDAELQKVLEESIKTAYAAAPRGPLPPVVIREPESRKYQSLPEVPGKGKAKVSEEHVAHDLLSLQKPKKKSDSIICYVPVEIMDHEVNQLKQSHILNVKLHWNSRRGPEFTWEREEQMKKKYTNLFAKSKPTSESTS